MGLMTRILSLAAASLLVLSAGDAAAAPTPSRPQRIVSLNACADEYLIALADKSQIAALTQFARDPSLSFYAQRAQAYPYTQGQAEAVLALRPDLVVGSPYHHVASAMLLRGKIRIIEVRPARSFEDIVKQTRMIAAAIGQPARGEALIATMRARVAAAGGRPLGGVAAHYQRGGFVTGPGTLVDDLMTRAGLTNLARRLHGAALGQVSLEQIVYQRPDFLVVTDGRDNGQDEGDLNFDHPALARAVPEARRLHIPAALTVCGGPSYPEALERLQAEADRARGITH